MKYDVFISYSRKDYVDEQKNEIPGNVVSVIKDTFHQHGITYWMDEEGNLSGKKFAQVIASKIRESMVFLFVCTRNSVESDWVDMELSVAVERKKRIIPFVCDDSYKDDRVIMFTASHDRIEYFVHSEKELEKLVAAIENDKIELEQKIQEAERQKQAEEERKKAEELRRQREQEELHRIEEQKRIVRDIKIAYKKLNNEEKKLLIERDNLLLKTEDVTDTEERDTLRKDIQESGPISQKYREERLDLIKEIERLKDSLQNREKEFHEAQKKATQLKNELMEVRKALSDAFKEIEKMRKSKAEEEAKCKAKEEAKRQADARGEFTVNGVCFKMIPIEGGTFQMGSETGDSDDRLVHEVKVNSFSIGQTEVTQELWKAVMGTNPSYFEGDKLPVERVSWNDCQTFIKKLNLLTGKTFRLPTEAEWEFAARGGNQSKGYTYSGSNTIDDVAWYTSNSNNTTHVVATKSPNELGIYDMSGNVWEWCQDWYGSDYYSSSVVNNPTGPSSGSYRVLRGGSWGNYAMHCRVAYRSNDAPTSTYYYLGFRLAL